MCDKWMTTVRKSVWLARCQRICETDNCKTVLNILSKNVILYYSGTGAWKGFLVKSSTDIKINGPSIQESSSQQGEKQL